MGADESALGLKGGQFFEEGQGSNDRMKDRGIRGQKNRAWGGLFPLAIAVLLRVIFFVGLASGDPQDDGIYYQLALSISQHGLSYLNPYEHLAPGFIANPIDQFPFRPLATYPTALVFKIVGPSEI